MYPTFIAKNSPNNCGHFAFDRNLAENNIGYFCYIKFYIDKHNTIRPLVAGMSTTELVSNGLSDLSFSKNIEHGPARKFLDESNLDWYYEQVAIYPCKSLEESAKIEKYLQEKYKLFGS